MTTRHQDRTPELPGSDKNQNLLILMKISDRFESVGEDEPNCSRLMIGPDMTPENVTTVVLEKVNVNGEDSHL